MSGPMAHFDYVSDNGNTYPFLLNAAEATAVGGVTPPTTVLNKLSGMVPRYILAQHPTTGRERKIKCPNPADAHWVGGTNTISLPQVGSATPVVYDIRGRVGEKRYKRG
jgi:hypothetical protein